MQIQRRQIEPLNQVGEKQYRNLKSRLSYSALKLYSQSRYRFYKELILGEVGPKDATNATIIGDICHTLLAGQIGEYENKFHLSSVNPPKGQLGELCQELYKRTLKTLTFDEETQQYKQSDKFETLFMDAVQTIKFGYGTKELAFVGKSPEKILELFTTPDKDGVVAEIYYKELMYCVGKQVVSENQLITAEKCVEVLKTHEYTRDICNLMNTEDVEVFNELIILYTIDDVEYRSMVDKAVIDHNQKTIQPWDFKFTFDNENGFEYSYLSYGYFLQVGLYDIALNKWKIEHDLSDYKVLPMKYIACDTTGNNAPVIYTLTEKDVLLGQRGFTIRGKKYHGVLSIHQDIMWNLETSLWNTCKKVHDNNGEVEMKLIYR